MSEKEYDEFINTSLNISEHCTSIQELYNTSDNVQIAQVLVPIGKIIT